MEDDRFKGIATDPRFRPLPSRFRKVKIDERFKGMFTEKKFRVKCTVDERGRPVKLSSNKHLKKFYELSSEEEEEDEQTEEVSEEAEELQKEVSEEKDVKTNVEEKVVDKERRRKKKIRGVDQKDRLEDEQSAEDEENGPEEINPMLDYARGVVIMSSSSEDDESDDEAVVPYDQEAHDDHYWGEQDADADSTEQATSRLAIQNMDWDRIKARDLYMLLNSFKPASGTVKYVKIYPSEFGKEKMTEDELTGPKELKNTKMDKDGGLEGKLKSLSDKDQKRAMLENMRQYQLNRLKYYYAVAEFDSAATANHIYTECDGQEYLASCTQLDLRFIPDEMEFDEDELKDSANHVPESYEPKFFINPALGQSLVRCTWDESGPDRYSMLNRKYGASDLEELDMKAYLASESDDDGEDMTVTVSKSKKTKPTATHSSLAKGSPEKPSLIGGQSSESEAEDEKKSIDKYRQLLLGGSTKSESKVQDDDSDGFVDMEITWDTGLKDTTEDILKKKQKSKRGNLAEGEKSVFQREREKKREKAKQLKLKNAKGDDGGAAEKVRKKKGDKLKIKEATESIQKAFSDDECPDDFDPNELLDSPQESGSSNKKKKRIKKQHSDDGEQQDAVASHDLDLMLLGNTEATHKKHFNIKEIAEYDNMSRSKRKRKLKKNQLKEIVDDFEIDVKDDRFSALYSSHLYNVDPSSQMYRKTKAMDSIIDEKQRQIQHSQRVINRPIKRKEMDSVDSASVSKHKKLSNISSLVKSVKAKANLHSTKQNSKDILTKKKFKS